MQTQSASALFSQWKPIEIMLALLFLIAPFYHHEHIGGMGLRISNNVTVWIVANIIGWISLYIGLIRQKIYLPKYFRYIAAFPVFATVSGFVTGVDNPMEWLFRLLFIWCGLLFFLGLFQHKLSQGRVDRILFIFVISALMQGLIGIAQILFVNQDLILFPKSYYGVPFGMFEQINNQAIYQVTAFVVAIYLITRPYIVKGAVWRKIVLLSFFCVSSFIISYSGSRAGTLAILLSLPFAIIGRRYFLLKYKRLTFLSLIFVLVSGGFGSSGFITVSDKMADIANGYSTSARLGIYAVSLDLIKEKPLFGHGIGSFTNKWQFEKAEFYNTHPNMHLIEGYVTHPHNELFFWAIESGVVGIIGIFIFLLGIGLTLAKTQVNMRWGIYLSFLIPIMLHTQVELPFHLSALHWFLALFLLFVLMRSNSQYSQVNLSKAALLSSRTMSLFMLVLGTVFLFHTLLSSYELGDPRRNVWQTPHAKVNPYFSDIVESTQMKSLLQFAMKNKVAEDVEAFAQWGEDYLPKEPSANLLTLIILAYQDLGKKDDMCRIMHTAYGIYPFNDDFIRGIEHCKN